MAMRQLARLLILIPLALVLAIGAGGLFLMMASVVSPALAAMIFGAGSALADAIFGLAIDGDDPGPLALAAGWRALQLMIAALVAPPLLTALVAELFRMGGAIAQMTLTGALAMALPAAMIGLNRLPTGAETSVLGALFLTGVVAGAAYWAVAGRGAAGEARDRAPIAPPPRGS